MNWKPRVLWSCDATAFSVVNAANAFARETFAPPRKVQRWYGNTFQVMDCARWYQVERRGNLYVVLEL